MEVEVEEGTRGRDVECVITSHSLSVSVNNCEVIKVRGHEVLIQIISFDLVFPCAGEAVWSSGSRRLYVDSG